jgi:proteic killer suppression protein
MDRARRAAGRKLRMIDSAADAVDLRSLPGNRLEKSAGDRKGQRRIRINDPRQGCSRWDDGGAWDGAIVDDH